jgi:hypothetical protein
MADGWRWREERTGAWVRAKHLFSVGVSEELVVWSQVTSGLCVQQSGFRCNKCWQVPVEANACTRNEFGIAGKYVACTRQERFGGNLRPAVYCSMRPISSCLCLGKA